MKSIIFIGLIAMLTACQNPTSRVKSPTLSKAVNLTEFAHNSDIAGKIAKPIRYQQQEYWLLTSEKSGLLLTDKGGKQLSQVAGNVELLDWRNNIQIGNQTFGLMATLDNNLGQVLLIALDWKNHQLTELTRLKKSSAKIESLCFYQMPQGHLSLFTTDVLGQVVQRIVLDGAQQKLTNILVQEFIGAPQTQACVVDDKSGSLYLAEENIGVWRYSANHESELARELIIATKPHGPIIGEVIHLDVLQTGELLVSAPEQQGLWLVQTKNENQANFVPLNGVLKPGSASALQQNDRLQLGVFDEETGKYFTTKFEFVSQANREAAQSMSIVKPYAQTTAMAAYGDAADDPAIWVNTADSKNSRVLGTNKKQGLMQYDLQGNLLQQFNVGRVNNVDIRYGMQLDGETVDIATASNRTTNSISVFSIQPETGEVAYLSEINTNIQDVYGLCMYKARDQFYVFINGTDGHFQQYLLEIDNGQIGGKLVREFYAPSQPEGCVVDDQNQQLYYGEEAIGVWQTSAEPNDAPSQLIIQTNTHFVADVEGLAIYRYQGQRFLFASSQGNDSYGVFALDKNNRHLGSFKIDMDLNLGIDGVSETDGIDITSFPLGAALPAGLLVVQDGRNRLPMSPQNFKLVDAQSLQVLIDAWLD